MNKIMRIIALTCCLLITVAGVGCAKYANDINFSGNIAISDDGTVKKAIFEELKNKNTVASIEGKSNGIKYCWTVFGSDIETPADLNMGAQIHVYDKEEVDIKLNTKESFGFCPVISVYVPEEWKSLTATVKDKDGSKLCGASLTTGNPTIVNFALTDGIFEYKIIGDGAEDKADNVEKSEQAAATTVPKTVEQDGYLTAGNGVDTNGKNSNGSKPQISDGKRKDQDKYKTDPIPEGKQEPVEPENVTVNKDNVYTCTFSIECSTILNNIENLNSEKLDVLPKDGIIFKKQKVRFYEGESVFDVLQRVCKENKIHLEASWTPMYNSAYVEGINNLYEFDCGELSGWMYRVNGWYPNYGCSRYALQDGDTVEWRYTCDLGRDVGCDWNLEE